MHNFRNTHANADNGRSFLFLPTCNKTENVSTPPHQVDIRTPASCSQSHPHVVLFLHPAFHLFQLGGEVVSCDAKREAELFHLHWSCRQKTGKSFNYS